MARTKEMPKQHRKGLRWLALILVLVCELLAYTWVRTESTHTMLRISKIQSDIQKKLSHTQALNLERERLKSDARITGIAKDRLGLSSDIFNQTIYLSGDLH